MKRERARGDAMKMNLWDLEVLEGIGIWDLSLFEGNFEGLWVANI